MWEAFIDQHNTLQAKEHCTLSHILSLWETISVELARQLWERGQEPFETLPEEYMKELIDGQKRELNKCLRRFDLGQLLGALFEFIEVHLKQITANITHKSTCRYADRS